MNSLWSVTAEARPKRCFLKRDWPQVSEPVLLLAAEGLRLDLHSCGLRLRNDFDASPALFQQSKSLPYLYVFIEKQKCAVMMQSQNTQNVENNWEL